MIQDKENKVHPELYGDFSAKSKGKKNMESANPRQPLALAPVLMY